MPSPLAPSYLPVPPVSLYGYSLRWEPSSQLSCNVSPPLKLTVQVPAPSSFHQAYLVFSYTVASDLRRGGIIGDAYASASVVYQLMSFIRFRPFHLSITSAIAPASLIVSPALAALQQNEESRRRDDEDLLAFHGVSSGKIRPSGGGSVTQAAM